MWDPTDFIPPDLLAAPKIYFGYGMDFDTLVPGDTQTQSIVIQSDSDFMWCRLVAVVNDPAAPETGIDPTGLTINVTDDGSGRNFFSRAVGLASVAAIGNTTRDIVGGYLAIPTWIDKASQVNATIVSNRADAQDVRIRLLFDGFKIFGRSQAGLR